MITRGYLVGNIIDSWSNINEKANIRCDLNLTDLPIYLEDYFCEVLNISRELNLSNINSEKSNFPGIDLIDRSSEEAWQVTMKKGSEKINSTLENIKGGKFENFDIYVLIVGSKQSSYGAVDDELCEEVGFSVNEDIWDITDLSKKIVSLPLDRLKDLDDYVRSEEARIQIELEVPNSEGEYPTSFRDFAESIPKQKICGIDCLFEHLTEVESEYKKYEQSTKERLNKDLKSFVRRLKKLPRITRQFYVYLLENLETREPEGMYNTYEVNLEVIKRKTSRYSNLDGELSILESYGFIRVPSHNERARRYESLMLTIKNHGESSTFLTELLGFSEEKEIGIRKLIVNFDFSDLGKCED